MEFRQRVEFKIVSLVYQMLSSKVPICLADDIYLASESSARSLRSSSVKKCSVTHVHSRFGDRCFAAAGPRIWNNLPARQGSQLHRIQKTTANIHASNGLRRIVTFDYYLLT